MRRGHPTFLEQQLPPLDNVGKVQQFPIGTTTGTATDVCAVEDRAAEQAAAFADEFISSFRDHPAFVEQLLIFFPVYVSWERDYAG